MQNIHTALPSNNDALILYIYLADIAYIGNEDRA